MRALGEAILNIPSLFQKRHTNARDYFASTIQTGDIGNKWMRRDDQYSLVASYVGMTYICASIVGTACASGTIRLYRPVRGKSKGRKLNRKQKAWMRSTVLGYGPGTKAARMASNSDEIEEIVDSPVIDLLNRPNNLDVSLVEDKLRFVNQGLCGNHYVNVITRGGQPVELLPMYPQWTRLLLGTEGPYAVRYGVNGAQERDFPLDEVIHFKHESDPQNRWYGRGVLKAMWVEHQIMLACNQKDLCLFDNQARPDFAVMVKQGGDQNMITALEQKLRSKFQGANKAGNFVVLSGESVDIKPLTFSPKEMADDTTRARLGGYIAAAWGVPESLIKMNEANLASAAAGNAAFARYTVLPWLNQDAAVWTEKLLPMFGYAPGEAWLAYDSVVPEDETARATVMVQKVGAGILTINEARAEDGYEPIEGGDDVRVAGRSLEAIDAPPVPMFGAGPGDPKNPDDGKTDPKNDEPLAEAPEKAEEKSVATSEAGGIVVVRRKVDEANHLGDKRPTPDKGGRDIRGDEDVHPSKSATDEGVVSSARSTQSAARSGGGTVGHGVSCSCGRGDGGCSCVEEACIHKQSDAIGISALSLCRKAAELDVSGSETEPPDVQHYRILVKWFYGQRDAIIEAMDAAPFGLRTKQVRKKEDEERNRILMAWLILALYEDSVLNVAAASAAIIEQAVRDGGESGIIRVATKYPDEYPMPENPQKVADTSKPVKDAVRTAEAAYIAALRDVNKTTADRLAATVNEGLDAGEGLSALKDRVRAVFDAPVESSGDYVPEVGPSGQYQPPEPYTPTKSEFRAAMIAAEEGYQANQVGVIAGFKEAETKIIGQIRKVWIRYPLCCEFCEAMSRQFNEANGIPLDNYFYPIGSEIIGINGGKMKVDYQPVDVPPLHPGCRCHIEPVIGLD